MKSKFDDPIDWLARAQGLRLNVRNLIEGRCREAGGETLEKVGPRDGHVLCRFGAGDVEDVDAAVSSARRAFEDGRWSKLPVQRRKEVLLNLASRLSAHREEFALLECLDVGKPI